MVKLRKSEKAFLEDNSDKMLNQIHSQGLENCHFHSSSWTALSHKFAKTPFTDHSD